jgi:hypothetical protein
MEGHMPMIRVDDEVYERLAEMGRMADSYNDVLRRVLGLPKKEKSRKAVPTPMAPDEGFLVQFFSVADKHLPKHWSHSKKRMMQILWVIAEFLKAPKNLSTGERQLIAAKQVAKEFGVEVPTVQDKCGRQLYGTGTGQQMERFRRALEKIEADWPAAKEKSAEA